MIAAEAGLIAPPPGVSPIAVQDSLAKDGLGRAVSLSGIHMGVCRSPGRHCW